MIIHWSTPRYEECRSPSEGTAGQLLVNRGLCSPISLHNILCDRAPKDRPRLNLPVACPGYEFDRFFEWDLQVKLFSPCGSYCHQFNLQLHGMTLLVSNLVFRDFTPMLFPVFRSPATTSLCFQKLWNILLQQHSKALEHSFNYFPNQKPGNTTGGSGRGGARQGGRAKRGQAVRDVHRPFRPGDNHPPCSPRYRTELSRTSLGDRVP